jgi:hypothetical protein
MDREFTIPVAPKKSTFTAMLRRLFLVEKLNNPFGITLLFLLSTALAFVVTTLGYKLGAVTIIGLFALPIVFAIVAYPVFGILVYFTFGYFIMWFLKLGVDFPLGTLMDGMEALFILSLFIHQKKRKDWSMFSGPISFMALLWIAYNCLEYINPVAASREAWMYTIRTVAIVMFNYFVFTYYLTSKKNIKHIFKLWICLALFAAAYAFKQEHIGFFDFEEQYLHSDPGIELLLFIGGVWRKFSIFSDPVAFAYNMVTVSFMCIGLYSGVKARWKKMLLAFFIVFFLLVMLYSGTRGAYVLVPAGLVLLAILKFNRKVMIIMIAAAVLGTGLVLMPTSNQTIYRFQTAFKPSEDASFNLRKMNQKRIQPYILSHPMGGGLGSTGEWGKRFSPGTYLSNFPPDSGYVRVAVEQGWIGLFIFCSLMATIMVSGVNNYFKIQDPELKSFCLIGLLIVFALNFGNYPQEALVQFPSNIIFYLGTALITISRRLDTQQNQQQHAGQ